VSEFETKPAWPKVSVIMPIRNEAAHLVDAVSAVLEQNYLGELEICLAIAPSTDDTASVAAGVAATDSRILLVNNPAGITPTGLNAAIAATTGEVVVRVDGHCELSPGYIATAVQVLAQTGAANVGGRQMAKGDTAFSRAVATAMTSIFGTGGGRLHLGGKAGPTDTVYLGVFRRDALNEVGGFAEDLIRNQDYELNIRLRAAGHTVWFDPRLAVRYSPRDTWRGLARQYYEYGWWKWVVARRHPGSLRPRQAIPAAVTAILIKSLVLSIRWPIALLLPIGYLGSVLLAAMLTGREFGQRLRLIAIYPTMHLGWGLGFWGSALAPLGRQINRLRIGQSHDR
jgi:succinoglycan biosynthesis protein ExoA